MLLTKAYRALLRIKALREAQWFYKSEPAAFTPLSPPGPNCPACGTPASHRADYPSRVRPFAAMPMQVCARCGLSFVTDVKEVLNAYYTRDYAQQNRQDRDMEPAAYFKSIDAQDYPAFATYVTRSTRQISLLQKFGAPLERVLDYGSGPGYILHLLQAKGAHAVEPDLHSHKYLQHLGATIHADLSTVPEASFDTIVASHTIEHLSAEELQPVLRGLLSKLTETGRLLIEVPQGGHSQLHLRGERQDPHTLFFTGEALVQAVKRAGGQIVFQQAVSRVDNPRRDDPIYTPSGSTPFFITTRGGLTVICARTSAA